MKKRFSLFLSLVVVVLLSGIELPVAMLWQKIVYIKNSSLQKSATDTQTFTFTMAEFSRIKKNNKEFVLNNFQYDFFVLQQNENSITVKAKKDILENKIIGLIHHLFDKKNNSKNNNTFIKSILHHLVFFEKISFVIFQQKLFIPIHFMVNNKLANPLLAIVSPPPNC